MDDVTLIVWCCCNSFTIAFPITLFVETFWVVYIVEFLSNFTTYLFYSLLQPSNKNTDFLTDLFFFYLVC